MTQSANRDRQSIEFSSADDRIHGWHYPPQTDTLTTASGAPAVVMAHGLAATKDCGLDTYARRFAKSGMHVLVFDYRGWGESGGGPRDVVLVHNQLATITRRSPTRVASRASIHGESRCGARLSPVGT